MERLAKANGDVDAVVAMHAPGLAPSGHTHLVIAWELDTAGRSEEALGWAERARASGTSPPSTPPLSTISVTATRGLTGAAEAVVLRRDHFGARRALFAYQ